jgi:carnitine monooxygenase subunit
LSVTNKPATREPLMNCLRRVNMTDDPRTSATLPGWAYTDLSVFEREKTDIFYKSWQYAGWIGEIANPGDFVTSRLIDQNVIILRAEDGSLRGFHNACRHRGHHLLQGRGRAKTIVCPYHAWTYGLDGTLRSARGLEMSEDFDISCWSLKPIRVDLLAEKLIFFNLDMSAPPLAEMAADLEAELRGEIDDFDRMLPVARPAPEDGRVPTQGPAIAANWKVVIDNCLECYHCRPVHPGFRQLIDLDDIKVRSHSHWATMKGHPRDSSVIPDTARNKTYRFWWLWPNTFIEMAPGGAHGFTVGVQMPLDIARTEPGRSDRYGIPGAPLFEPRGYGDLNLVPEDREAIEAVQRNIASLGYGEGRFSYDPNHGETSEEAVHRFQWLVATSLRLCESPEFGKERD